MLVTIAITVIPIHVTKHFAAVTQRQPMLRQSMWIIKFKIAASTFSLIMHIARETMLATYFLCLLQKYILLLTYKLQTKKALKILNYNHHASTAQLH